MYYIYLASNIKYSGSQQIRIDRKNLFSFFPSRILVQLRQMIFEILLIFFQEQLSASNKETPSSSSYTVGQSSKFYVNSAMQNNNDIDGDICSSTQPEHHNEELCSPTSAVSENIIADGQELSTGDNVRSHFCHLRHWRQCKISFLSLNVRSS